MDLRQKTLAFRRTHRGYGERPGTNRAAAAAGRGVGGGSGGARPTGVVGRGGGGGGGVRGTS